MAGEGRYTVSDRDIRELISTGDTRSFRPLGLRFGLILLGIILSLLVLEGALRMRHEFTVEPATTPDARLGHRGRPSFPGHDSRGWRNATALAQSDIVAFGDSQTYGVNAPTDGAWPQQLGKMLHRSAYQMALGGYGPAHYIPMLEDALTLKPKAVIAAYYFGNDAYDSYALVYRTTDKLKRSAILNGLASADPKVGEATVRAERLDPDLARVAYIDCQRPVEGGDPTQFVRFPMQPLPRLGETRPRFTQRLALVKAARRLRQRIVRQAPAFESKDYGPPFCVHYRGKRLRTILNVGLRTSALDESDPRIVEGERISVLALMFLAERCRQTGVRFYVLMIPTKESAFRQDAEVGLGHDNPHLMTLWNLEERARARAIAYLTGEGIPAIDTLPALQSLIASGGNPYLENADGHPARIGYEAIARAAAQRLGDDGLRLR